MIYDEFLKFLDDFEEIKSFAGKVKYADQHLQRIGAGTGRIVYDIDGTKVFKIAKNAKGVAQNSAESDTGRYEDTNHITTKVFEFANDDSWIIAEKGKKVNEKRIIQLTGIPSLNDLYYYVRNFDSSNHGRGNIFGQDEEIVEQLNNNEFAQDLTEFIANYSQQPGDYGRPSTYGEVLRDGQPTIVLTDYGLNDEVYDTYYNPQRKQRYRMYEMFGFGGNDDMLSDIGSGDEVRHGMWALMPYGVGDGDGVVNEDFISFVLDRDKYPKKLPSAPYVLDRFHECVNNLKETLKNVTDKKRFYNNLLTLQENLISQNLYDREPLEKEEYSINEANTPIPPVEEFGAGDSTYGQKLADLLSNKIGLPKPVFINSGSFGHAFRIGNELVLKITSSTAEAESAIKILQQGTPTYLVIIYDVYKIVDTENNKALFAIIQEYIPDRPKQLFDSYNNIIDKIMPGELNNYDIMKMIRKNFDYNKIAEIAKKILTDNPEANINERDRTLTYKYLIGLLNIKQELINYNVKSSDYTNTDNLGYKNGVLRFFDIGNIARAAEPIMSQQDIIYLPEGQEIETLNETYDRKTADEIANKIAELQGYDKPRFIGSGTLGVAYDIGNDRVLKITKDNSEAAENLMLIGKPLKYIAQPYNVFKITQKNNILSGNTLSSTYAIILEKLETDQKEFERLFNRTNFAFEKIMNVKFGDVIKFYLHGENTYDNEVDKDKVEKYFSKNPQDAEYFYSILRIAEEADKYGVESKDFYNPENLGYKKSGVIGFFDVGFGNFFLQPHDAQEISVDEDGSSRFSTDNEMGQDGFPTYNQNDTSPLTDNNVPPVDEDLEYNHVVGDATEDKYMMSESVLTDDERTTLDKEYPIIRGDEINGLKIRDRVPNMSSIAASFYNYEILDGIREVKWSTEKPHYYSPDVKERVEKLAREIADNKEINPLIVQIDKDNEPYILEGSHRVDALVELGIYSFPAVVVVDLDSRNELSERKLSYMPGAQTVSVKKKCRLGGLGNTSVACNQGDINNLDIKKLDEEIDYNKLNRGIGKDEMLSVPDFPLKNLRVSKRGIVGAIQNIKQGNPSQTDEPVLVFYNIKNQQFLVEDGYHRVAQAYLNKEKTIPVSIYSDMWSDYVANIGDENQFKLNEANTGKKYYRAVEENGGKTVEFKPEGYYEAIDDDGNPVIKYDTHWISDKPEVAASHSVGGAMLGLYSMFRQHGKIPNVFYIYEINEEPDVDISHWDMGDFSYLQEVRYRRPVQGKYAGKVIITDNLKEKLDAFYEIISSEEYEQPIYDPEYEKAQRIFQDTDYDELLGGVKSMVHENTTVDLPSGDIQGGWGSYKITDNGQVVGEMEIMNRNNQYLALDKIFIYKPFRGKGYANDAMKLLFDYADDNNKILTLTPDNVWGASVPKLKAWYSSLGFVMNKGKNKDFKTMQLMYRLPKSMQLNEETYSGKAYRVESGFSNKGKTAGDVVRFERDELGNVGDFAQISDEKLAELDKYPVESIVWITKTFEDAKRYSSTDDGSDIDEFDVNGEVIGEDGDGGYLILIKNDLNEAKLMSLQDLPFKQEVEQLGGKIFSVGGAVRDEFLGKESKDLDVLITGVPFDQLEEILGKYGRVDAVGKSFGVLKFRPQGGEEIDIAIPRTEKPTGDAGHKAFDVTSDHALPIEKDLERRDFTINAIAKDIDGNIVDPYGGQEDLKNKIIRIVNPEAFSDDPLRMLRAVQFASRFGFAIEPETLKMIQSTAGRIKEIPPERILTEFDKIVKKGDKLTGAQLLKDTGLFNQIFGFEIKQSTIDRSPFDDVKTMGEFIFLLTRLLSNPAEYYKNNLKGDIPTYKEIKALDMAFGSAEATNLIEARAVASNMYLTSPQSLQSDILPTVIETAAQELLQGKYPKSVNELAINGNDLMELGLKDKEIGNMQKSLLLKIYADKVRNNREELLNLAGRGKGQVDELYMSPNDTVIYNMERLKVRYLVKKYDIWNYNGKHYSDPTRDTVREFLKEEYPDILYDKKLSEALYHELIDRELLNENEMRTVSYSAVVLDELSQQKLISVFKPMIPEGWKIYAHHMTIKTDALDDNSQAKKDMIDNATITLNVEDYAINDKVMAVGVNGYESVNTKSHITLAVNVNEGGKPVMSNQLTDWKQIPFPLTLTGKVIEVPFK